MRHVDAYPRRFPQPRTYARCLGCGRMKVAPAAPPVCGSCGYRYVELVNVHSPDQVAVWSRPEGRKLLSTLARASGIPTRKIMDYAHLPTQRHRSKPPVPGILR